MKTAYFLFHGNLNGLFGDAAEQERPFTFTLSPSLKDAMESMGVPHVEAGRLVVNGLPAGPGDPLRPGDRVEVFPVAPGHSGVPAFVADSHLGKLVRELRLLGLDTLYHDTADEKELVRVSLESGRVILTRSLRVLKYSALREGCLIRSEDPVHQLREVTERYELHRCARPFTRCLNCNGLIRAAGKEEVLDVIPPLTARYFDEFFRCTSCGKVYWKGSHYDRMLEFLRNQGGLI